MPNKRDYFKLLHQKTRKEATRIPKAEEILKLQFESLRSKYPVRALYGTEGSLTIREEERRNHLHIIGTTGEGKSKFLEWLIRQDINNGNGLVFLDPSDRGDTMYKILSYCAEIGFEKVLVIDPHLIRTLGRVPVINPFTKHKEASVANIMDTIRILFKTKDASETPRIERYLPAILSLLWNAEAPLSDALYFTDFHNPYFRTMRNQIIEKTDPIDRHRIEIEHIFSSSGLF